MVLSNSSTTVTQNLTSSTNNSTHPSMGTFLFDKIIFGPIYSRRLGQSLGLNLLPTGLKICTFNCVYCECGWTETNKGEFVSTTDYESALELKLAQMVENGEIADALTFAGNGEPTLHPHFGEIIDITIKLRDKYMSKGQIAVLSNSTTLDRSDVFDALLKVDQAIMKLDAGSEHMFRLINQPNSSITLNKIVQQLKRFNGNLIVQTLLLKGIVGEEIIDNTTTDELQLLGEHLQLIHPHTLMLYSIARGTPLETLSKVEQQELEEAKTFLQKFIPESKIQIY